MKETYNELQVTPSGEYERFASFILSLTNEAIEERGKSIIVRSEESLEMVKFGVKVFAKSLTNALQKDIEVITKQEIKENIDWISRYKVSIQPIEVGEFYIHPSWIEKKQNRLNITIDPALAFGSGHHETTYGCLLMLQKYLRKDDKIVDVGCGSGILSLACASLEAKVDFCDTDEIAVQSSISNFELNQKKYNRSWIGSIQKRDDEYNVVVANIIADVLIMLAADLMSATKKGGILILSGILDKYADRVKARFSEMEILETFNKDEWHTLVLKR